MRLGYFGGSFDPPHLGHLAVASAAADSFALDRVLLVPTASQPLKPAGPNAPYRDRLAMVSLLCQSDARLHASGLEAPLSPPAPNYTIDTLERIAASEPSAHIFVIVGADAFHQLPRWRSPGQLLQVADWIVVTRPHSPPDESLLPPLTPSQRARVHRLTSVDHPASATALRAAIAQGSSCTGLLPPTLLDYIHQHHLYKGSSPPS